MDNGKFFGIAGQTPVAIWDTNFFSKTVVQGQNAAINLIIATFILYHPGVVQEWYKRYKKIVGTVGHHSSSAVFATSSMCNNILEHLGQRDAGNTWDMGQREMNRNRKQNGLKPAIPDIFCFVEPPFSDIIEKMLVQFSAH